MKKAHIGVANPDQDSTSAPKLTSCVKQTERVGFATDHDRDGVVVEHGRYVLGWKFVGRVGNEQAGLTDRTVTNDHALYCLHSAAAAVATAATLCLWGLCLRFAWYGGCGRASRVDSSVGENMQNRFQFFVIHLCDTPLIGYE